MENLQAFQSLGIALAIGLLIGVERGWHHRAETEGKRFAGLRTFGLIGLMGGLCTLLAQELHWLILGFTFAALALVLLAGHWVSVNKTGDYGITTVVASLATFVMGALAVAGYEKIAAASAVVMAVVLGSKALLHRWLESLQRRELFAGFQLLVISVVVLPLLPNREYGPWGVLNPYVMWWMVVLICAISFVGYFAVKIAGTRMGIFLTALFGGLASSTAVTLNLSRLGREDKRLHSLLASGVLIAAATMFPRLLLLVGLWDARLLDHLWWPIGLMFLFCCICAFYLWYSHPERVHAAELTLTNPFEMLTALKFGALLVAVMLLAEALRNWAGDTGVLLLSFIAGLTDVDAITLSLTRMSSTTRIDMQVAAQAIVYAVIANTVTKAALAAGIARGAMAWRVGLVMAGAVVCGILGLQITGRLA